VLSELIFYCHTVSNPGLLFFHVGQPGGTADSWFTHYHTSDVAKKLCRFFGTERTAQGNDYEMILTVKMETRHPVEGLFGSE